MLEWLKSLFADGEQPGTNRELAERGENLAARYLRNKGLKILLKNYRCEVGEIDIIARDGKKLVFVEVKTREGTEVSPQDQVDAGKQERVIRTAKVYLSRYGWPQPDHRFDIVAIVWPTGHDPQIEHFEGAF